MNKSEDNQKRGISLRKKRSGKPKISAPKQISAPLPINNTSTDSITRSAKPSLDLPTPTAPGLPSGPRPRARPQNGDATADLIQRRYSTRFVNAPNYEDGAPPVPSLTKAPGKYAVQAPPSRDGMRPSTDSGRRIKVDVKALSTSGLNPDQCT